MINAISNIPSIVDNENERKLIKQSPEATNPGERSLKVRMDLNSSDRRINPLGGECSAVFLLEIEQLSHDLHFYELAA